LLLGLFLDLKINLFFLSVYQEAKLQRLRLAEGSLSFTLTLSLSDFLDYQIIQWIFYEQCSMKTYKLSYH